MLWRIAFACVTVITVLGETREVGLAAEWNHPAHSALCRHALVDDGRSFRQSRAGASWCGQTMVSNKARLSILGMLAVISLASTDLALALQLSFGRRLMPVLSGPSLAATGAALFALWRKKQE